MGVSGMWHNYYSVTSVEEAVELLSQHGESARIVAGATDLLIELEQGKRPHVSTLIDITRVPGLDRIEMSDGVFHLGPLVNHNHAAANHLIIEKALPLAQACWEVGAPQIRNRATIAGNLITASPANDTISPLLALGAEVTLKSITGERSIPLAEFYSGLRQTVMRPDEMLVRISFPAFSANERGIFLKFGLRRAQAISVVNAAIVLCFDGANVSEAKITLGCVAPTVVRATSAEQMLIGKPLEKSLIREVAQEAAASQYPINDVRSTAEYRSHLISVLVSRALNLLANDAQAENYPSNPAMLWGENEARVVGKPLPHPIEHSALAPIEASVNGKPVSTLTGQSKTLLHWLREDAGLPGTKEGCAEGECGACTVFLDGVAVMACMVPAPRAHRASIVTIEGLRQEERLHPIQAAFVEGGAVQCGYCTPGFVMAGAKLLEEHETPTQSQIEQSISGNLCRCTGYYQILEAFKQAARLR